jgi:SMODS-associated and fused to various effectors sensor domain
MTSPLPLPGRTGVRIAGDRYQWLVAWHECVNALRDNALGAENPAIAIGLEVDHAGNLDDVVVRRRRPPHTYKQVKYSVDSTTPIGGDYLLTPSPLGGAPIIRKIADAWRTLTAGGEPVEVGIVTNRLPDPNDPLITKRDARTRRLLPRALEGGPNSQAGMARQAWATAAGLSTDEFLELLAVLDFDIGRDQRHLEETVKLTMLAAGLGGDNAALAAGADWVAAQVVAGHRQLELAAIRSAIAELDLYAGPPRAIISIATLAADPLASQAQHAIDWVDRFDGADPFTKRRPMPPATWDGLQTDIAAIPEHLVNASNVVITGSLRQATAFAVGASLRMVTGTDVAVMQRASLWSSDAPYQQATEPVITEHTVGQGTDLAVAIEISTPITNDVLSYLRDRNVPVERLVTMQPPSGARDNSIRGAEGACALAVGIRDAVRRLVPGHQTLHLFLAGPMGLALLLGHRWNRILPTIVYEDLAQLGYDPAFRISA